MTGLTINDSGGTITKVVIDTISTNKLGGVINANNIASIEEITVNSSGITQFTGGDNLKKIILTENNIPNFSAILPGISSFNSLTQFTLSGDNVTTGSVPSLDSNTQLEILDLNDNNLTGSVPAISSLPALKVADFSQNSFTGNIPLLSANHELETFAVSTEFSKNGNNLTGSLPILSSTKLRYFAITQHQLRGEVHDFHDTPLLENYFAFECGLSGNLPAFSAAPNLKKISWNENLFTGSVPYLNNLTSLVVLNLNNNGLSGKFSEITNLSALERLRFNKNDKNTNAGFIGDIPDLSGCPNLITLDIAANGLSGYAGTVWPSVQFENLQCQKNDLTTAAVNTLLSALCATGLDGSIPGGGTRAANFGITGGVGENSSPTGGTLNPQYLILKNTRGWNIII